MVVGSIGQTSNVSLRPALMRCRGNLEAAALHFSTKPLLQMVTHIMPATLLFYFNPISEMTLILWHSASLPQTLLILGYFCPKC